MTNVNWSWPRYVYRLSLTMLVAACLLLFSFGVSAQEIRLTPQQRQLLNQLPPDQRDQALEAIRQFNQTSSGSEGSASSINEELDAQFESPVNPATGSEEVEGELKVGGNSRLVIKFTPREDLNHDEAARVQADPALTNIYGSHYFELDYAGVLAMPGLPSIPLKGLTAEAIEKRLGAEPALKVFDVSVALLDVSPVTHDVLKPFGYNVFEMSTAGLEPARTGPVPPDYVLGPGDSIRVQFFGNVNGVYEYEVSRDGILNLPEIGPVTVAGSPFSEFRESLIDRVERTLIGTQVSITMGQLRTIRVFVLGDSNRPGSYVVSSLSTISSALYASGGVSNIGSLRSILLKRRGKNIAEFDLYDLLLRGDTSNDERLQPGDVVFVPPVRMTVGVGGAVRRPAIYELKGSTSVTDVIDLAGGLHADAFPGATSIERINDDDERIVLSVDANSPAGGSMKLADGDSLFIPEALPELRDSVVLAGHVQRAGPYQLRPDMRLTDLLPSVEYLKPGADADYILIRRENPSNRTAIVVSAKLSDAWVDPDSRENIVLQSRDTIHVFSLAYGRQRIIQPILKELELQSRFGEPFREVSVAGNVKAPGVYPLEPGMRISDLIRAGGNLSEEAYTLKAELARYETVESEYRAVAIVDVDLDALLAGSEEADLILTEHDNLRISSVPQWDSLWSIQLEGEVKFPGEYRIRQGETLRQVLERAGGLTGNAFPEGAVFLRDSLRQREQEQIDALVRRMEADLTSLSLETLDTTGAQALETGKVLLDQLREVEAVGRLIINLERLTVSVDNRMVIDDVELRDGDQLLVPKHAQEVTVIGETQQNTSHLYRQGLSRDDYIEMSGGLTRRADRKLIYVVRASGAVVTGNRSKWLGRGRDFEIRPGDTIVVPLETDRVRPLTLWTNVTQILYQAAIAIAAVNSFDN